MAKYSYKCLDCGCVFEIQSSLKEKEEGGTKFVCPKCGSKKIAQKFSASNFLKNVFCGDDNNACGCGESACGDNRVKKDDQSVNKCC